VKEVGQSGCLAAPLSKKYQDDERSNEVWGHKASKC